MDSNTVFDDIMQGLHEVLEHKKGNIKLKSYTVTLPDDEMELTRELSVKISRLPMKAMQELTVIVDNMLVTNQK